MDLKETVPSITALVYDKQGGTHAGSLTQFEDVVVVDPDSYISQADVLDEDYIPDRKLAVNSISRVLKLRTGLPTRPSKSVK